MSITRRSFLRTTATAAAALPLLATTARAATHTVTIKNMAFSPANLTIAAGDTVTWVNEDRPRHSAMGLNGEFDTGLLSTGDNASLTFSSSGTVNYRCGPHRNMRGSITVG